MKYSFYTCGHENVLADHLTTLEFTKEGTLTKRGNCILGVNADFDSEKLKAFTNFKKIRVIIGKDVILTDVNPDFISKDCFVVRRSAFASERTLGINADKAAIDISRETVNCLKNPNNKLKITIESIE